MSNPAATIELLLGVIDRAYDAKSWHGTTLRGALRGLTPVTAAWRPQPARHNIWELVVHAAYWKYVVRRRLTGEKRGSFPYKGSDWFVRPEEGGATAAALSRDVDVLGETHRTLREAIAAVSRRTLDANLKMITGVAAHDLYHAGQIQLLKRLGAKDADPRRRRR